MRENAIRHITRIERAGGSQNANPTWRVIFDDGDQYLTEVDGQVGYGVNNPEYRTEFGVIVTFSSTGRRITRLETGPHEHTIEGRHRTCSICGKSENLIQQRRN
jgi:hypothetical protein